MTHATHPERRAPANGFVRLVLILLAFLAAPALGQDEDAKVRVSTHASRATVAPGDQLVLAVVFDHAEDWHIQANKEALSGKSQALVQIPTEIGATPPAGWLLGPVQWPKAKQMSAAALGDPKATIPVFEGRAIAYVPLAVPATAAPGRAIIGLMIAYQACDETSCLLPVDEARTIEVDVIAVGGASSAAPDPAIFGSFDASIFPRMLAGTATSASELLAFNFFGRSFSIETGGAGFLLLLVLAFLGGVLLNLTPCVLPVIPIKIMGLASAADHGSRRITLGVVMFLGVVAFWMAIGAAIAFVSGFRAINQLFQYPAFSIGVGAFIAIMGVGMLGVFTVNLPQWVYSIDPKRESVPGSFVFGIMTAVLSTPCTAPFMGTAAAWAAKEPASVSLTTFAAIGVGMGLPYLILAMFPRLVAFIPRAGPASELIKQVMGILMLGVAVFFVGTGLDALLRNPVDPPIRWYWWIVGGLVVIAGLWLAARTVRFAKRPVNRFAWAAIGLVLASVGGWLGASLSSQGPIAWQGYTPERLAKHLSDGKVVVLDFTAEWCINCKALEKGVLHQGAVVALLKRDDVVPMKVDLTGNNQAGQAKLKELNWVGIPLLAIYGPGLGEPLKYDSYTVQTVQDAIEKAKGPRLQTTFNSTHRGADVSGAPTPRG